MQTESDPSPNSGADCNQTALLLQGIRDAGNVDLSVYLGIFIDGVNIACARPYTQADSGGSQNNTVFQRQLDAVVSAIQTYGTDHIAGITVGVSILKVPWYAESSSPASERVSAPQLYERRQWRYREWRPHGSGWSGGA